eukprot:4539319-Heterocapsa_arctica.AAC.1
MLMWPQGMGAEVGVSDLQAEATKTPRGQGAVRHTRKPSSTYPAGSGYGRGCGKGGGSKEARSAKAHRENDCR